MDLIGASTDQIHHRIVIIFLFARLALWVGNVNYLSKIMAARCSLSFASFAWQLATSPCRSWMVMLLLLLLLLLLGLSAILRDYAI